MTTQDKPYQVKRTSLNSYKWLRDGNKIGERQLQVFNLFVKFGPMSAKMMHHIYQEVYKVIPVDGVSPRIAELREMGMLVPLDKDKCGITGSVVDFSRAAEADERVAPTVSTKAQTKKTLESALRLVTLWKKKGSLEAKHKEMRKMMGLLAHFYPDDIAELMAEQVDEAHP